MIRLMVRAGLVGWVLSGCVSSAWAAEELPADRVVPAEIAEAPNEDALPVEVGLTTQLIRAKPNAGFDLRVGRQIAGRVEANLRWTSEPTDAVDATFLGVQWGLYLEGAPVSTERFELNLGLGADIHTMFNIHSDFVEVALSTTASGTFWFTRELGAIVGLRAYPLASSGLELGTDRSGARTIPILATVGLKWRSL
jgi:hypothetical protein